MGRARDGALLWQVALAGGAGWLDEAAARAAGVAPGVLDPTALARLTVDDDGAFLVGLSDHRLYAVRGGRLRRLGGAPALRRPATRWRRRPTATARSACSSPHRGRADPRGRRGGGRRSGGGPRRRRRSRSGRSTSTGCRRHTWSPRSWTPVAGATGYLAARSPPRTTSWCATGSRRPNPASSLRDVSTGCAAGRATAPWSARCWDRRHARSSRPSDGFLVVDDDVPWVELTAVPAGIRPDADGLDDA
ncbi:MAG: hypothetical protein M0C28_11265 [Candidatus Moduliflexus flocculans]|nr:hypothetical protein [Candidatus Moduliflexus flocculans]